MTSWSNLSIETLAFNPKLTRIYTHLLKEFNIKQPSCSQFTRRQAVARQETSPRLPAALAKARSYLSYSLQLSRKTIPSKTTVERYFCWGCNRILGLSLCLDPWASCPFLQIQTNYSKADSCLSMKWTEKSINRIDFWLRCGRPRLASLVSTRLKKTSVTLTDIGKGEK